MVFSLPQWLTSGRLLSSGCVASFAFGPFVFSWAKEQRALQSQPRQLSRDPYDRAYKAVKRFMVVNGVPGLSIGVSIDGETVWRRGFGLANVELNAECNGESVMRIASISKSISAVIAGRLVEQGKLELDKMIYDYLPDFPRKKVDDKDVTPTVRQLLSHTAGIRHYKQLKDLLDPNQQSNQSDAELAEFFSNQKFTSVSDALSIFKEDALVGEPGQQFHYTTHGFTLLSAVLEKAAGKTYQTMLAELTHELGMNHTGTDTKEGVVGERSVYYRRSKSHTLENVPEVDNSNKWAGGGLISNVSDLLTFANAVLYSHQSGPSDPKSLLQPETIRALWTAQTPMADPFNKKKKSHEDIPIVYYCLGWQQVQPTGEVGGVSKEKTSGYWFHGGAGVGASSILFIKPTYPPENSLDNERPKPRGICIAILINLQYVSSRHLAEELAEIFEEL